MHQLCVLAFNNGEALQFRWVIKTSARLFTIVCPFSQAWTFEQLIHTATGSLKSPAPFPLSYIPKRKGLCSFIDAGYVKIWKANSVVKKIAARYNKCIIRIPRLTYHMFALCRIDFLTSWPTLVNSGHHVTLTWGQIFKLTFRGHQKMDMSTRLDKRTTMVFLVFSSIFAV